VSLWMKFTAATEWARGEDFYHKGTTLATRWMSLSGEVFGLEAMMSNSMLHQHEPFEPLVLLAARFDIEVARPYIIAGILDGDVIAHCIANGIDADMARSLNGA